MKIKFLLFTLALGATLGTLTAQDIHFSLYNMSPLTLNPALTGAYEGTARVGGIYRDQWRSFLGRDLFATPSVYIDAPIIRGFRKNDWVGVGFTSYNDLVGSARFRNTAQMFSASYHLGLNKERRSVLTIGLQGGSVSKGINSDSLIFGNQLENPNEAGETFENANYIDINAGVMFRTNLGSESSLEIGLAFDHLNQPRYSFEAVSNPNDTMPTPDDVEANRPMTITAHGKYERVLTDKWSIAPTFLFQTTSGATELNIQAWGGYEVNLDYKFNFGLGYRLGDAAQLLAGLDFKENLCLAFSYDINTSSLNSVTNTVGGFELAAWYIFKIYKKPSVKPAILCPQF